MRRTVLTILLILLFIFTLILTYYNLKHIRVAVNMDRIGKFIKVVAK